VAADDEAYFSGFSEWYGGTWRGTLDRETNFLDWLQSPVSEFVRYGGSG